jgi:hypothetical protein
LDGSLVFVHGTGVRDISASMQRIRAGAQQWIGLPPQQVHGLEWGLAVGPTDLDVRPALPPDVATRALNAEPTDSERGYALWNLLVTDPSLELRLLASSTPPAAVAVVIGADPPALVMQRRLEALEVAADVLVRCGITTAVLQAAAHEVGVDPALLEAATALGVPGEAEVASAAARSITARLLADCGDSGWDAAPALCLVGAVRDEFVDAVTAQLAPGTTRGIVTSALGHLLGPLVARTATRVAVARRESLMDPLSDFIRDVAFYVRNGERVRRFIEQQVAPLPRPVVLLGHSLGGIAAVDMLSRPSGAAPGDGPVDLLVTVGSQAPLLYLMDALATLEPGGQGVPFEPWLNVYNRSDLLSFCASRVFPNATRIWDEEVDAGVPFPASHSAYWMVDRVFQLIADHWPTV